MFWPFKKKAPAEPPPTAEEIELYEQSAQNLINQGIPAWKVERAMKLVRRYVSDGSLPTGVVKRPDDP